MPVISSPPLLDDPGYAALKAFVIEATGLAYYADKDDDLIGRLHRRIQATEQPDCQAYLELLGAHEIDAGEFDRLVDDLTVGETSFFRHPELFTGLREIVLPDLIARNQSTRRLRIWSAGCSIGAETYSLGILLAREFSRVLEGWEISILGTDINRRFLARARDRVFRAWDLRDMEPSMIEECFVRHADEWTLRPEYLQGISFQYHNLARRPFSSGPDNLAAFDLILCRNVLIYFEDRVKRDVISGLHECLVDGGWLLVGHAEPNVELFQAFQTVNVSGAVLYQRPGPSRCGINAQVPHDSIGIAQTGLADVPNVGNDRYVKQTTIPSDEADQRAERLRKNKPLQPDSNSPLGRPPTLDDLTAIRQMADAGDLESAFQKCNLLAENHPLDPMPHLQLAMLTEHLGRDEEAQTSLRRTIYLDPNNSMAHYILGLLAQKRGRAKQARQAYRQVQRLLTGRNDRDPIPGFDGTTVDDLRQMTAMQMEALEAR